jgi:hypothetical protein
MPIHGPCHPEHKGAFECVQAQFRRCIYRDPDLPLAMLASASRQGLVLITSAN